MGKLVELIIFLSVAFDSITAEFQNPYPPVAALFGPKNKFLCNAVVLTRGRILTTADCLFLQTNKTCSLGKPEEFHVALETHSIQQFQNGKAFAKGSRWKYLDKLSQKFGAKYDNKYANGIFSDKLKVEETSYLMKALRSGGLDSKQSNSNYVQVVNFTIHPLFRGPFSNDLAVLEVSDAYPADNSSIVEKYDLDIEAAYNRVVQVHGFGVLSHGANETNRTVHLKVRTVEMYFLPPVRCQQDLGSLFKPDQHMCLKPKTNETLCFGFTGAPIVLDGKLIGIVEFGHFSCSLESPVVGIRLDAFEDFLDKGSLSFLDHIGATLRKFIERIMGVHL